MFDASHRTLSPPPSTVGVDWMSDALSQMEAPLRQASSPLVNRMLNSLGRLPSALLGIGVRITFLLLKINIDVI